jgi:hypothetical protein
MARHNGGTLYSWNFFSLELGTFGRKEIICTLKISHLLLKLGGGDSEKILAY